ncbi:MAG: hypothetical protein KGD63_03050 [Candidatus Lokiarchaeota archaeon]|nr:hypothetical protein [Candidatus Lokiarchaeota archaeon]
MTDSQTPEEIKTQIESEAYYLAEKKLSYEELCWMLAEESIKSEREVIGRISKFKIEEKAKEIFKLNYSEDELCWNIAQRKIKSKK